MSNLEEKANNLNLTINSIEFAQALDKEDLLSCHRNEFIFPPAPVDSGREKTIYLCGNSLGLQPVGLDNQIQIQLKKWSEQGVEAHFEQPTPWLTIDDIVVNSMARLVGAKPSEVVVMNSLTTNLHLMMSTFYHPTPNRYKIITEKKAFPSDTHAVVSQIKYHNFDPLDALIEVGPREGEHIIHLEDILSAIEANSDSLALVMFSGVQYFTGQFFNIKSITEKAHSVGAIAGFDLAHAVGNVPLSLHDWGCDFACWCTYKYLNSGPGCIGGCFVHENNTQISGTIEEGNLTYINRFSGWWGHRIDDRFVMGPDFIPAPGAYGFRLSNPPVVCVACVRASLDIFDKADLTALRSKSLLLTGYLEYLLKLELSEYVSIFTPSNPEERGCQLSLAFPRGDIDEIFKALQSKGVVCDTRKPNIMRVAPTPLYNSFQDVYEFVTILKTILSHLIQQFSI